MHIIIKALIVIMLFFAMSMGVGALQFTHENMQPFIPHLHPVQCSNNQQKIWLINYAGGDKIHSLNQNFLNISATNKCIDNIISYNKNDIDQNFFTENKQILLQKRGVGYWLWKPYIIAKTLQIMEENDILLYIDSGSSIINPIDTLTNALGDKNIMIFENSHTNKKFVKKYLLQKMDMDNDLASEAQQKQATYVIARNNSHTRAIVQEWLKISKDEKALTDIVTDIPEVDGFLEHRHDQAILSLLYLKYPDDFKSLPEDLSPHYFIRHHRLHQPLITVQDVTTLALHLHYKTKHIRNDQ